MSSTNPAVGTPESLETGQLGFAGAASAVCPDDRRVSPRRQRGYWASLLSLDGEEVIGCCPDDVGEGGLHLTAPVGYGFAVGQRYELLVGEDDGAGSRRKVTGEGHYATVVRTRFLMGEPGGQVGVGLRFDHPIVL